MEIAQIKLNPEKRRGTKIIEGYKAEQLIKKILEINNFEYIKLSRNLFDEVYIQMLYDEKPFIYKCFFELKYLGSVEYKRSKRGAVLPHYKGYPDFFVSAEGDFRNEAFFIEVKYGDASLTRYQKECIRNIVTKTRFPVVIVKSINNTRLQIENIFKNRYIDKRVYKYFDYSLRQLFKEK